MTKHASEKILGIIVFGTLISIMIMANLRYILPGVDPRLVIVCLVSFIISVLVLYIYSCKEVE